MTELIKITSTEMGGETINTVNARDLWAMLESKRDFSNWIKYYIDMLCLEEGLDFSTFLLESTGGRPATEYHITVDIAKHLAMMTSTAKGREVRNYFLECEKRLKAINKQLSRKEILQMALEVEEKAEQLAIQNSQLLESNMRQAGKIIRLVEKVNHDEPLVTAMETLLKSKNTITMAKCARYLSNGGQHISRNGLFEFLREKGVLLKQGRDKNLPSDRYYSMGWFGLRPYSNGEFNAQTQVTAKGFIGIHSIWSKRTMSDVETEQALELFKVSEVG